MLCAGSTLLLTPVVRPVTSQPATPSEVTPFFYWSIKPWFRTEGKLDVVLITPSSWGSPTGCLRTTSTHHQHARLNRNTRLWLYYARMLISLLLAMPMSCYYMDSFIHAMPVHPSVCLQYLNPAVYCNHRYCCFYFATAVTSLLSLL